MHPGCCDVLTQLHSLAELRLPSFCRAVLLPCLPSLTRLRQLVLGGRPVDLTAARRSQTAQLVYMEGDDAPGLEGADGMPTREDEQSDGAEWLPPFDVIGPVRRLHRALPSRLPWLALLSTGLTGCAAFQSSCRR